MRNKPYKIPTYRHEFPTTILKTDPIKEEIITREQTFYDKIKQIFNDITYDEERENGIIFYLSDNSSVMIDFQEIRRFIVGGDYFMFYFKDQEKRPIAIKESSILYFEIIPLEPVAPVEPLAPDELDNEES